jgi:hypothetical protein
MGFLIPSIEVTDELDLLSLWGSKTEIHGHDGIFGRITIH